MGNPFRNLRASLILAAVSALGGETAFAGSVFGTVVDSPSFDPIEGAWVYLTGKRSATDSMRTDSSGAYRFTDVADCGMGCEVLVRMPGYWIFESRLFTLAPEQNLPLDIQLDMIHSLTVRVVKAEDTSQPVLDAKGVVSAAEFEFPRFAADSAGAMDFRELHSFTAYLLTVSAPGRRATSNNLHFHGPPVRVFWQVALEPDSGHSAKTVRGTLSAKDGKDFPGARAWLSCRSAQIVADLFADAGTDGAYAIEGVPAECDSAMLFAGTDSIAVALTETETEVDWAVDVKRPTGLRPARGRTGSRTRTALRPDGKGVYDLIGRKFNAGRARSRP
jgi:hypothetical protein